MVCPMARICEARGKDRCEGGNLRAECERRHVAATSPPVQYYEYSRAVAMLASTHSQNASEGEHTLAPPEIVSTDSYVDIYGGS